VAVNYGGHPSVTDELVTLAKQHNIMIVEDNAHGLFANDEGVPLGTKAALSTLSFHETKNITCGEGGALVINDPSLVERAEIIREKGTNRSLFFRGMIDKYTWVDKGSSYLMSDINAALLTAQLEHAAIIQRNRHETFRLFMEGLADWSSRSGATLPYHLASEDLSAHLFPILMPNLDSRSDLIDFAKGRGIGLTFHYVPLHLSPGGLRYGRTNEDDFSVTKKISDTLVRLPLYAGLTAHDIEEIIETVAHFDVQ
jgi:dTDP-4-amino-4,6-dideoxygalactose transaminase